MTTKIYVSLKTGAHNQALSMFKMDQWLVYLVVDYNTLNLGILYTEVASAISLVSQRADSKH